MFENLQNKISGIFDKLKGKGVIDETSLNEALREIRVALLESDVSISVAKILLRKFVKKLLVKKLLEVSLPHKWLSKLLMTN